MKKYYTVLVVICMTAVLLYAGGKKEPTAVSDTAQASNETVKPGESALTVKVVIPGGAPVLCAAQMISGNPAITETAVTVYEVVQTPDVLQARLISGEADIAVVPSNLASVLYAKGTGIRLAGAIVWGILYGIAAEPVNSMEDLRGKTIVTFGRGLTPDITVREILTAYGLMPDTDVTLTYVQSGQEAAAAFISGKASFAVLPEPMVSMILTKKPTAQVFLDIQAAWKEKLGGDMSYPQAVIVMQKELIDNHPEYAVHFLDHLKQSVTWAKEHPMQAGEAAAEIQKGLSASILAKGIERMNLRFVNAEETRPALEKYFSILYKANPKFIGGALPQNDFYYTPAK